MSHFKLVRSTSSSVVFLCSKTVAAFLDATRPAGRRFQASPERNSMYFAKFMTHAQNEDGVCCADYATFAKAESGRWYVETGYIHRELGIYDGPIIDGHVRLQ